MYTYRTNFMGPASLKWFEDNNVPFELIPYTSEMFKDRPPYKQYEMWFGGRIDCRCSNSEDPDYDPFGSSLELPIMDGPSFGKVSEWIMRYKSKTLDRDILEHFEKANDYKIRYFIEGMYKNHKG